MLPTRPKHLPTRALSPERPNALVEDTSHHGQPTGPQRDATGGSCWRRLTRNDAPAKDSAAAVGTVVISGTKPNYAP